MYITGCPIEINKQLVMLVRVKTSTFKNDSAKKEYISRIRRFYRNIKIALVYCKQSGEVIKTEYVNLADINIQNISWSRFKLQQLE